MKTKTQLMLAMTLLAMTLPAAAQHQDEQTVGPRPQVESMQMGTMPWMMQGGMMQGGMMQGMHSKMIGAVMNDPFKRSALLVRVIPTMRETLALLDTQVARLQEIAQEYLQRRSQTSEEAEKAEQQVQELLASDEPDADQLRTLLRNAASFLADLKAISYESALAMKGELSDEQREKLADMTPMQMHHHMMTNMTMMEMMQAMQCDKMHGGMMASMQGDGMMRH